MEQILPVDKSHLRMFMSRCQLLFSLSCVTLVLLVFTLFSTAEFHLSEVEQDDIDLKTVDLIGNKTEVFEKWRQCAEKNWMSVENAKVFWRQFEKTSEKCDKWSGVADMGVITTKNRDDRKNFILPKDNNTETNLITLGIGEDISAELSFERKMKKLGKMVKFYGADPMSRVNSKIYSTLGKYFPFAIGMKSGKSNASVLVDKEYVDKTVIHKDILTFVKEDLQLNVIDNLWIDAEFAEYDLFQLFEKDGMFKKNQITVCQVNLEIHLNQFTDLVQNSAFQFKFMKFVKKMIGDRRFGIFRATEAHHLRIFMFNFESDYCRRRF